MLVQPHLTVGFNTGNEVSGWTVTTTDEADVPTGVFYLRRAPVIGVVGRVPTSLTLTPLSLFFSLIAIASILPVVPLRLAGTNIRRCNRARTTPTPELIRTDQPSIACELEIHEIYSDCETGLRSFSPPVELPADPVQVEFDVLNGVPPRATRMDPVAAPVCLIQAAEEDAEIMWLQSEREKVKERRERLRMMEELDEEERQLKRRLKERIRTLGRNRFYAVGPGLSFLLSVLCAILLVFLLSWRTRRCNTC